MKHSYLQGLRQFIRNKWVLASLVMTAVFLIINYPLINGSSVGIWDVDDQFMPYQILLADHIRQGQLLIWDSWSNGGVSLSGDPQVGALSPINILLAFVFGGSTFGFIFLWLFVWWLGGFGVLLLGRHFKVAAWATLLVSLEFLFTGLYISNAEHTSWLVGFSFLPLIIWRLDVSICSKSFIAVLQSGALWGLSALSSYPGFAIATALFCFMWGSGRLVFIATKRNNLNKAILFDILKLSIHSIKNIIIIFFLWLITGLAVLSPTYFSFLYDGAGTTTRVGTLSKEAVLSVNPLPLGALSSLSSPFLPIQRFNNPSLWEESDISMISIYAGILPFWALLSILSYRRSKWTLWILFLALFTLGLSLSTVLPFRGWLYDYVYPTRFFKHSSLFRAYFLFSVAVLALSGLRDISSKFEEQKEFFHKKGFVLIAISGIIIAFFVFFKVIRSLTNVGEDIGLAYVQFFSVWAGLFFVLLLLILKNKNNRKIIAALLSIIVLIDIVCTYKISKPVMMSQQPEMLSRWQNLDKEHSKTIDLTKNGFYRQEASCLNNQSDCDHFNNDQMIKKVPVFGSYTTQFNKFHSEMLDIPLLKNTAFGKERIWFSSKAVLMIPEMSDFSIFSERIKLSDSIPLVVHTPHSMVDIQGTTFDDREKKRQSIEAAPSMQKINTRLIKYVTNELTFEITAPTNGWVLLTDRWARNWNVTVNNLPSEVYGGNFIFRAVSVNKGKNVIHFYYQPTSFYYLIFVSWGTLLLVLLMSIRSGLKKNK